MACLAVEYDDDGRIISVCGSARVGELHRRIIDAKDILDPKHF